MEIGQVIGIAVCGALLTVFVRQIAPEISVLILLMTSCGVLLLCVNALAELFDFVALLERLLGDSAVYIKVLCKLVGIAFLCQCTCDLCKDTGCMVLANQIEFAGKLAILVCAIPIFRNMMELIVEVVKLHAT